MTPNWINRWLESDSLWVLARGVLTFMYWYDGLGLLIHFSSTPATMAASGVPPNLAVAVGILTIICELLGSALIIADRYVWFGAGMLGVFTLLTILLVHHFWTMKGSAAIQAMLESEEHLTVIGGLVGIAILSRIRKQWKASRAR